MPSPTVHVKKVEISPCGNLARAQVTLLSDDTAIKPILGPTTGTATLAINGGSPANTDNWLACVNTGLLTFHPLVGKYCWAPLGFEHSDAVDDGTMTAAGLGWSTTLGGNGLY